MSGGDRLHDALAELTRQREGEAPDFEQLLARRTRSPRSRVWAAAAAIGDDPRPDSFEKIPRATPQRIVIRTVAPANPPAADVGLKAWAKINCSPSTTLAAFWTRTIAAPAM